MKIKTNKKIGKILRERAALLQVSDEEQTDLGDFFEGLVFMLSNEKYAIDATFVNEVISVSDITPLPGTPSFLVGIINLRGKILSVIDIKSFFNLNQTQKTSKNKILIVNYNGIELGIVTDDIIGNSRIYLDKLQKKLSAVLGFPEHKVIGVSNENLIVLDIKKMLLDEKLIINEEI
jgi:purine-binding chemotaxis protein CheW